MKRMGMWMLILALLAPVCALADSVSLMMELPQDAQMIENVDFDDGDYIRTYQLGNGGVVQLLRYAGFDMEISELAESEYPGSRETLPIEVGDLGGWPTQSLRFLAQEEGQDVTFVCVSAGEATLILKAALPQSMGEVQISELLLNMISTLDVSVESEAGVDEMAEVG